MHVKTDGDEIVCTREHPFYVPVRGWTAACDLRTGDILVRSNGEYVVVEAIKHELLESPITVYNFEVEDFHTYHVGSASVLVHNKCVSPRNGTRASTEDVLDMADEFLGNGYNEPDVGRFVSADGQRQVRMLYKDLVGAHGGGPHVNFDILSPKYKSVHVFFFD